MYASISTNDLKGLIGRAKIIDIRDNYLYRLGNIPSSQNIPMNFLLSNPDQYLKKEEQYYIYCTQGMQSSKLCYKLAMLGYNVVNVSGGYNDYMGMM